MFDMDKLYKMLDGMDIAFDIPLKNFTTFRIGGNAKLIANPSSGDELKKIIESAKLCNVPYYVIGNGSNLLISDDGYDGIIIRIGDKLGKIEFNGTCVTAGAGALLCNVANKSINNGLMGMEWASGIPGTVGGAVAMNAGAYGGEIKDILKSVTVYNNGDIIKINVDKNDFGYRLSKFAFPEYIVVEAEFSLMSDDGEALKRANEYSNLRKSKQPLSYPSAGSTFKRPEGNFAGALIEKAGLKGYRIGGAQVSELHAGFVINVDNATFEDVYNLIEHIRERVYELNGIMLEPEVKIIKG